MEWPRLFVPSSADDSDELTGAPSEPSWVLDAFVHVTLGADAIEVLTGLDAMGALALHPLDERHERLSSIRAHLAHAEVASPARRRVESARDGLWLFALELVEQLPDAPGPNDPIYLYGTMWPAADPTMPGVRGQLACTRGDLLRGLVDGARWAFRFPPDEGERVPRAFHMLLPGDRADALATGRGLVLAYPAMDPGLIGSHAGNDLLVVDLTRDVLAALYADPDREPPAGDDEPLPVTDRAAALSALEADGWEIDEADGVARRKDPEGGFLKRLVGGKTTTPLPREGGIDDFIAIAERELTRLPGWPTAASQALFARVGPWTGGFGRTRLPAVQAATSPRVPAPPEPPREPARPAPRPPDRATPRARRDDWMQDFVSAHAERRPQLTRVAPPPPRAAPTTTAPPKSARPDWMKDFD